jgi:hypothetical protein
MERVVFNALVKNAPFAAKLSAVKRSRASSSAFRDPLASSLGEADPRLASQQLTPLAARERLYRRFPAARTSSSSPDRARVSWSPREEIPLFRIVVETAGLHLFSPTFDFLRRFFPAALI